MKVGMIGFRGAGRTTVFNALTGLGASTGYASGDRPNLGNIKVPDPRVDFLAALDHPKKITFPEIVFVDVPGAEQGRFSGGLDERLVAHMREADALVLVVRAFANLALDRPRDAQRELDDLIGELILSDQIAVENRLGRIKKEGNKARDKPLMERLLAQLEGGEPISRLSFSDQERQLMSGIRFLSLKPWVVLLNCETEAAKEPIAGGLVAAAERAGAAIMAMAAEAEAEIAELPLAEQAAFSADIGLGEPARARFVRAVYGRLDLISFLTRGPDECRAWPIKRGTTARKAAGAVHSDIERGFIRAEVIAFEDFQVYQSEAKCREAGRLRVEGKDYLVRDGDLIHFRFNV